MNIYHFFRILAAVMLLQTVSLAQIPMDSWRGHFPYSHAHTLIENGNAIHCATEIGMFSYDYENRQINTFSTVNGLNDVFISTIARVPQTRKFIAGYDNGNLDLIEERRVGNFPLLKDASVQGDKTIQNIYFYDNDAYLCTGIGVVVLDIANEEIRETYQISPEAGTLVNDLTSHSGYFYTATSKGVFKAPVSGVNLMDFNNWQRISALPAGNYVSITASGNHVVTVLQNQDETGSVFYQDGDLWNTPDIAVNQPRKIKAYNNKLYLVEKRAVHTFSNEMQLLDTYTDYGFGNPRMNDVLISSTGTMWIADDYFGLIKRKSNGVEVTRLNGPAFSYSSDITQAGDKVLVAGGDKQNPYSQRGMYYFQDGNWTNINEGNYSKLDSVQNLTFVAADPYEKETYYAASWGYGLLEFVNDEIRHIYDERNTPLRTIQPNGHGYLRIAGMDFDSQGNLWLSTTQTMQPVYALTREGEWLLPGVSGFGFGFNQQVGDLLVTDKDHVWVALPDRGFLIISPDGEKKVMQLLDENGEIIDAEITQIAEDNKGVIWVGTTSGIAVYYNPEFAFESQTLTASRIIVNNTYLLKYDAVSDIYVDGGNRKWIGTQNSGAILLSADGKEQLQQFTKNNSPLPSNTITSIGMDESNGEVFFGTDAGIVSYRSDARKGEAAFDDVYVYPNPVRAEYEGPITIDGLMDNTLVKITDVTGNLVYQGTSNGAVFTWDGTRRDGQRASTGVYLVFCASPEGEYSKVSKFLML